MKEKKHKKLSSIINFTLEKDTIKYGKNHTMVSEISDLRRIPKMVNNINSEDNFKLMLNFNKEEYYFLQTTNNIDSLDVEEEEKKSEYIMKLYKSFYSTEELEYNEKLLKKNKKLKQEIAPCKFDVNSSYIETDRGYCIINIIESIDEIKSMSNIINKNDIWLIVDFNRLDQAKMLNIITKIEENNFDKVKIDKFIKKNIHEIKEKLRNEDLIQCEFKMLHYDESLDDLKRNNEKLINSFRLLGKEDNEKESTNEGIKVFKTQERLNIINAFNSSIYPYRKLEVTHSLQKNDFLKLIG